MKTRLLDATRKVRKLVRDPELFVFDFLSKRAARRRKTIPRSSEPSTPPPAAPPSAPASRPGARLVADDRKHVLPGWSVPYLQKLEGVRTVVDIGVLDGTPSLYEAFPDARLILIEALPSYEEQCRRILEGREGELHICAAGAEDGEIVIRHDAKRPEISSALEWAHGNVRAGTDYTVPLRRLDTLFADRQLGRDVLLKIDVQGMECLVIAGACRFLQQVKYVIAEGNVKRCYAGENLFADLVVLMKQNGFDVLDIMTVTRSEKLTPGATIADTLFVNTSLVS